jgi:hypothetical protein
LFPSRFCVLKYKNFSLPRARLTSGDQHGDLNLTQTESSNTGAPSASTTEGLRPGVAQQSTRTVILTSGLVVGLAFVELPLGFIQADYPSCKTAFNVYILESRADIVYH